MAGYKQTASSDHGVTLWEINKEWKGPSSTRPMGWDLRKSREDVTEGTRRKGKEYCGSPRDMGGRSEVKRPDSHEQPKEIGRKSAGYETRLQRSSANAPKSNGYVHAPKAANRRNDSFKSSQLFVDERCSEAVPVFWQQWM